MNQNLNLGQANFLKYSTPIALFGFNRPDLMRRQIETLREIQPARLFVVLDGARAGRAGEAELCAGVADSLKQIDWPCELEVHRSDVNLGCRKRMSSGITWVFSRVERAILLEDDCAPHPDFFRYAEELLERYAEDTRVSHISGFSPIASEGEESYGFTQFPMIWGWASWRRAWQHYDESISRWSALSTQWKLFRSLPFLGFIYWNRKFLKIRNGFNTWDYQWTFACLLKGGLCALPRRNLMNNLGFRPDATHTVSAAAQPEFKVHSLNFPLIHPRVEKNRRWNAELLFSMWKGFRWSIRNRQERKL